MYLGTPPVPSFSPLKKLTRKTAVLSVKESIIGKGYGERGRESQGWKKKQLVACNEINQKKKHPTCINHKLSLVFVVDPAAGGVDID